MKQYISYTRVSTSKQGLGLEAQTTTIESYVKNQRGIIIGCYSEKESGKETINRHELQKASAQAKSENAIRYGCIGYYDAWNLCYTRTERA